MKSRQHGWLGLVLGTVLLGGCGGGGTAEMASQESSAGAITGFGSIIVEGQKYQDDGAQVINEIDPTKPDTGSLDDLKLGMQVSLAASDGTAQTVTIDSQVFAVIDSLQVDGFVLAGQTVRVGDLTVYDGASGLTELAVGDLVVVYGERDDNQVIDATRVAKKDPRHKRLTRVVGSVSALDSSAKTFVMAGLTVDYNATLRIVPSVQSLQDGIRVAVYSTTLPSAGVLHATAIRLRIRDFNDGDLMRVGGRIRHLDFDAQSFEIKRWPVDASAASFVNGSASDLANRKRVGVTGTYQSTESGVGVIKASEVTFRRAHDLDTDLTGPISQFVSLQSFVVRGVPVDASAQTVVFSGGDASNLGNGVVVKIMGDVKDNLLIATSLSFVSSQDGQERSVAGQIRALDSAAASFFLAGVKVQLQDSTEYLNSDRSTATAADLSDGDVVRVVGSVRSGTFVASQVILRTGPSIVVDAIDGTAYRVDLVVGRFELNGVVFNLDADTVFIGNRENLASGTTVRVEAVLVEGRLHVRRLIIQDA